MHRHQDPSTRASRSRRWTVLLLVSYVVLLGVDGFLAHQQDLLGRKSWWDFQYTGRLLEWILDRMWAGLIELARFMLLGFLTRLSFGGRGALSRSLLSLAGSLGLATVVLAIEARGLPGAAALILPWTGCGLGAWIGARWLHGTRARLRLAPQILLVLLLTAAAGMGLVILTLEEAPLSFDPAEVSSDEKRRLVELFRNRQHVTVEGVATRLLRLTENDLDLLLAWGLSLGSPDRKAKVRLGEEEAVLLASVRLPLGWGEARYVNFRGAAQCSVGEGRLRLRLDHLQVGRLSLPRFALWLLSPVVVSAATNDPNLKRIVASVESMRIEPGSLEVIYGRGAFREVTALLERFGSTPSVLGSTEAHVHHLLSLADELPKGDERFGALLQAAFRRASERSRTVHPTLENRAAIYALGILAGHHRVADFIGLELGRDLERRVRRGLRPVTIRGRKDWTRHYFVSAALAQLSAEMVSDTVGRLKEELDAAEGGSGFSFSDLLADRAGTLFSLAATKDEESAVATQERLDAGFDIDDYFPPAADLPERIPDEELQSRYGGVDGPGYRELEREIERRLSECAALR